VQIWLPSLLKHEYIAQSSYEKAARMCISPTPDVVILWVLVAARVAAEDGATFWSNVVGIDVRVSDRTLFRVLEMGWNEYESRQESSGLELFFFFFLSFGLCFHLLGCP
jgi:hypothetical protein